MSGCASVGKPGYGPVMTGIGALRFPSERSLTLELFDIISQPHSESECNTVEKCCGSTPRSSTSPPAAAQAQRYVADTILSGIIRCPTRPGDRAPPRTLTVALPAPVTWAPILFKKLCSSSISGSRAAFMMTVSPSAAQAQSMAFSVAPTLGIGRAMPAPCRPSGAEHIRSPPRSSICAPRALRAIR